jgi:hypothetical protein
VSYTPPTGWIEELRVDESVSPGASRVILKFHSHTDCPRIHDATVLRQVDKPYSAVRCTLCADEFAQQRRTVTLDVPGSNVVAPQA